MSLTPVSKIDPVTRDLDQIPSVPSPSVPLQSWREVNPFDEEGKTQVLSSDLDPNYNTFDTYSF